MQRLSVSFKRISKLIGDGGSLESRSGLVSKVTGEHNDNKRHRCVLAALVPQVVKR